MSEELKQFIATIKNKGSVLGLENMRHLMSALGDVQENLPVIHIAGTNGKGSVGAYLESILMKAGCSVGRYTSPAVFHPMEVFTINRKPMEQWEYEALMEQIRVACLAFEAEEYPTVFEAETALAFLWFAKMKPDFVLLECGLGGETDATNVISKPLASVLTSISRDHMAILGDTLEKIAAVKSGIIKEGCRVYSAKQPEEVELVIKERAHKCGVEPVFVDELKLDLIYEIPGKLEFRYGELRLSTGMSGFCQMMNAALAVEVFCGLAQDLKKSETISESLSQGNSLSRLILDGVRETSWPGRCEVVHGEPLILLDGAHNEAAARELAHTIGHFFGNKKKITLVMGVLADKDYGSMLRELLPLAGHLITLTVQENPRALDGRVLAETAEKIILDNRLPIIQNTDYAGSYREALELALEDSAPVLFCGSLSYLGAVRREIEQIVG